MNTKKYLLTAFCGLVMSALISTSASAAVLSLSPTTINVVRGADIIVKVMIDPQGSSIYTAKAEIDFPKNLLSVESFTLGNSWMGLTQTGYDLTDNTNGVLIKSAGYPGGISIPATLGTIVFSAKASGNGAISFGSSSLVYNANSQNVLSGSSQTKLTISAPAVNPVVAATPKPVVATPQPVVATPTPEATQPIVETQPVEETVAQQPASLSSAIGNLLTLGTQQFWIGAIVVVLLLVIIGYIIMLATKKKEKQA